MENFEKIYTDPLGVRGDIYRRDDGLYIRDVYIHAGARAPVSIGHTADIHFNYCNSRDLAEGEPAILSTLENRRWLSNGESVPNAVRTLSFLSGMDKTVVNGDTLDYLSHGTMELMAREVFDKYPGIIATVGGHECLRKMQGKVDDTKSREERLSILSGFWRHDIFYHSEVIGESVLIVALHNDCGRFYEIQVERFARDLELARKNGYVMLLFMHEPIATHDPRDRATQVEDIIFPGDVSAYPRNLCDGVNPVGGHWLCGGDGSDEATLLVYNMIINNADVVRGVFAGHLHNHIYNEITAKRPDGTDAIIPQYITTSNAYDGGHAMRIFVD